MMLLGVLCAVLGALGAYLATPHQRLSRRLIGWRTTCRLIAGLSGLSSVLLSVHRVGLWAGVFTALTAFMLAAVLLPYVDVYRQQRHPRQHRAPHVD